MAITIPVTVKAAEPAETKPKTAGPKVIDTKILTPDTEPGTELDKIDAAEPTDCGIPKEYIDISNNPEKILPEENNIKGGEDLATIKSKYLANAQILIEQAEIMITKAEECEAGYTGIEVVDTYRASQYRECAGKLYVAAAGMKIKAGEITDIIDKFNDPNASKFILVPDTNTIMDKPPKDDIKTTGIGN